MPCPPFPLAPSCWPSSACLAPTADRRCRSPTGRRAVTTSSRARKAMHSPATSPWSAAAATPTRALYRWGNGLRACHELATLAPIMWQRSLNGVQPLRPRPQYRAFLCHTTGFRHSGRLWSSDISSPASANDCAAPWKPESMSTAADRIDMALVSLERLYQAIEDGRHTADDLSRCKDLAALLRRELQDLSIPKEVAEDVAMHAKAMATILDMTNASIIEVECKAMERTRMNLGPLRTPRKRRRRGQN